MTATRALPRILAGVAAAAVGYLFLLDEPLAYAQHGCTVTTGLLLAVSLPTFVLFAFLAFAPDTLAPLFRRTTRVDVTDAGHLTVLVLLVATLYFVLGLNSLVGASATVEQAIGACRLDDVGGGAPTGTDVLRGVTLNLAVFTIPILLYVSFVHGHGPRGTARALGLREEGVGRSLALGALLGVLFIVALALLGAAISPVLPENALDNPRALDIVRSVTIGGAFALAAGAAVGEEIFFRGFLQPRVGYPVTAALFALAHSTYGSVAEVVAVFLLALVLGALYRRTGNLWAPIAAHFSFDLIELLLGIYLAG